MSIKSPWRNSPCGPAQRTSSTPMQYEAINSPWKKPTRPSPSQPRIRPAIGKFDIRSSACTRSRGTPIRLRRSRYGRRRRLHPSPILPQAPAIETPTPRWPGPSARRLRILGFAKAAGPPQRLRADPITPQPWSGLFTADAPSEGRPYAGELAAPGSACHLPRTGEAQSPGVLQSWLFPLGVSDFLLIRAI